MLQISKNHTGNSSIIFDNSGFSGVNAGSHYIFLPKSYENGNFVCFGISLPSFAVKFLARSASSYASWDFRVAKPRILQDFSAQGRIASRNFARSALPRA